MYDSSATIPRCTILKRGGSFCDERSIEDTPFPVCARHAIKLYVHLSDLTDEERSALDPEPARAPHRTPLTRRERNKALRHILEAGTSVIYAAQFPDGIIKIGCTSDLTHRLSAFAADGGALIGFMPGEYEDEQEIHRALREHVARGREWYNPTPEVLAAVNEMRDRFNMPHLAA